MGQGSTAFYYAPPTDPVSLNADFVPIEIVMGLWHSCSVSVDGRVACWGYVGSLNVITTTIWSVTFGNGSGDDQAER